MTLIAHYGQMYLIKSFMLKRQQFRLVKILIYNADYQSELAKEMCPLLFGCHLEMLPRK